MYKIYLITNTSNNKRYVGLTSKAVSLRYRVHWSIADSGNGWMLHDAMRKYGPENFTIETMIEVATRDEAVALEIHFIQTVSSEAPIGYNLTKGGDGTYGHRHSEEHKKKVSEYNRARVYNPITGAKLSKAKTGLKITEETRRKMSKAHIGRTQSREICNRKNAVLRGQKRSDETRIKMSVAATARCVKLASEGRPYRPPSWAGKAHSTETKAKISASNVLRHAAIKERKLMELASWQLMHK